MEIWGGVGVVLMLIPKGNNDGRRNYNTGYFTDYRERSAAM